MGRPAYPLETTAAEWADRINNLSKRVREVSNNYLSDLEREKMLDKLEYIKKKLLLINKRHFKIPG